MCGIAGILRRDQTDTVANASRITRMTDALAHRGPDSRGTWSDPNHRVSLGHRRLAVVDPSPAGAQPMVSDDAGIAVTYNGEIYNFRALRRELEALGAHFRSDCDTEVLLRGYEQWHHGVLDRLVGMYAFAIWDERRDALFLARDRAGEKPLYYAELPAGDFAFASELSALTSLRGVDATIDADALSLYLQFLYVPSPYSIVRGVSKLAPGHAMVVNAGGGIRQWRYWDAVGVAQQPPLDLSETEALEQLDRLMRESIAGQMIADVPLGAFLSGGYDSSVIVSYMSELSAQPVRTFTIGFDDAKLDEAPYAQSISKHLGTHHDTYVINATDVARTATAMPEIMSEPLADPSVLPTYLLAKEARRNVAVCLSGDGGDEAFGGYRFYRAIQLLRATALMPQIRGRLLSACDDYLPNAVARALRCLGHSAQGQYVELKKRLIDREVECLLGRYAVHPGFARVYQSGNITPLARAMLADVSSFLPEDILAKLDRAAMANSLETRAPLLDHRLLEFAFALPIKLRKNRYLWKKLCAGRLPATLLNRPKQGFDVPLPQWLNVELRELLRDTLTIDGLRQVGIENPMRVQHYLAQHEAGRGNYALRLWALLNLVMWNNART